MGRGILCPFLTNLTLLWDILRLTFSKVIEFGQGTRYLIPIARAPIIAVSCYCNNPKLGKLDYLRYPFLHT
jgi:hypothetical protein